MSASPFTPSVRAYVTPAGRAAAEDWLAERGVRPRATAAPRRPTPLPAVPAETIRTYVTTDGRAAAEDWLQESGVRCQVSGNQKVPGVRCQVSGKPAPVRHYHRCWCGRRWMHLLAGCKYPERSLCPFCRREERQERAA